MFKMAQKLIELLGIDAGRLRLEWISSAEGTKFAEVATQFTKEIKNLGPINMKQVA